MGRVARLLNAKAASLDSLKALRLFHPYRICRLKRGCEVVTAGDNFASSEVTFGYNTDIDMRRKSPRVRPQIHRNHVQIDPYRLDGKFHTFLISQLTVAYVGSTT